MTKRKAIWAHNFMEVIDLEDEVVVQIWNLSFLSGSDRPVSKPSF